ncbi:helix-turn-helix domain-containing protein [Nocardia brasiliensis]|uniref:helix-turn-helix domain-containing protein n=1 Tax=Nocardia brasiliensis TaxID=37326 RepID=UPI002453FA56|nr:helix-turn-helix transcriptional regulator [Nocardia brasiliensis]
MTGYSRWQDIRTEFVERAGGEDTVTVGKEELLAEMIGHRLAEIRRSRGLTQQQIAARMGVTKGRISQIERGQIAGYELLARYAAALGGRLRQSIQFDDGEVAAIA